MHHDFGDYTLDLVRNSIEAEATRIVLSLEEGRSRILLAVQDNGCGMTASQLKKAQDPFWSEPGKHPGRSVGLGLPFFAMAAEGSGGRFYVGSVRGKGTLVRGIFDPLHPDCPPNLGLAFALALTMSMTGGYELVLRRLWTRADGTWDGYRVLRSELLEAAGGLQSAECLGLLRTFFESQENHYGKIEFERSAKA